ncbi:MAG TPA: hypothetical protein VHE35_02875 [Kofleriaceae bacterium]|nr:hypothetical protein [Kofleriaceae bacterium]
MRPILASLLVTAAACGKVESAPVDSSAIDATDVDAPAVDARAIDAPIDARPLPHWSHVATVAATLDVGNNRGFLAVGQGARIYFAPIIDSEAPQFHAFDVGSLAVSAALAVPPGAQSDFQASGFGPIFVADQTSIYLIGDDAERYDPTNDTWSPIAGYDRSISRGESNGAWHPQSNSVFMVGGRDFDSNTDQPTAIHLTHGVWATEPGMLPYSVSNGLAYALPADGRLFVAGGRAGDNDRKHLAVHEVGTQDWTALPDAPEDLSRIDGMGDFTDGDTSWLLASSNHKTYLFNLTSMTWDGMIDLPGTDFAQVVMVAGTPYAMVRNVGNAEIYKLVAN